MSEILDLSGRVAIVTGAGQGVGRQVALHFAAHGARAVVVNDFHRDRAEAVAEEVRALGVEALVAHIDVTDLPAVRQMVDETVARFGGLDILVNNAGNFGAQPAEDAFSPFWETEPESWDTWLNVNLYGVLNCCAAAVPKLIERQGGRIITVISDAGRTGEPGLEVYSAAKAGAAGLMRAMARSLGRHMITVNAVSIASTATPTTDALNTDPERRKRAMQKYVIRRQGQPTDVANMVLFLASDASAWITGQTYPVNGGFSFAM